jgi:hypothetical protein
VRCREREEPPASRRYRRLFEREAENMTSHAWRGSLLRTLVLFAANTRDQADRVLELNRRGACRQRGIHRYRGAG